MVTLAPRSLAIAGMNSVCCIPSLGPPAVGADRSRHHCRQYYHETKNIDGESDGSSMAVQSGPFGHHAVASEDIKAGSVIVQCLPLAHSILVPPGTLMGDDAEDDECGGRKRCARCFFPEGDEDPTGIRKEKFGRCSKCCTVYYCSRSCQAEDWVEQHKLECRYYVKLRKRQPAPMYATSPEEDAIPLLLRTFNSLRWLREKNTPVDSERGVNEAQRNNGGESKGSSIVYCGPHHFSSLMVSPEYHKPAMNDVPSIDSSSMALAKQLMESYAVRGVSSKTKENETVEFKLAATVGIWGYDENESDNKDEHMDYTTDLAIQRTLNAFKKNNFGIVNSLHSPIGEGVYPCAALLNHSCHPNCILRYQFGVLDDGKQRCLPPILQIVACKDICSGEELCHSYVDLALCTQERQARLMDTHGFVCHCERCTKGGCMVGLPRRRLDWDLWPLRNGFVAHGESKELVEDPSLVQVDIDDAMTRSHGLSESELRHLYQQSHDLQQQANRCMVEGEAAGELHFLQEVISLYRALSPFNGQLYSVRCSYLSALLSNGQIHDAIEQCEHLVSFLAVAFSHVENHPLVGLQLYTLGDLYSGAIAMDDGLAEEEISSIRTKRKLAYTWAKQIMMVTHGGHNPLVKTLESNLAEP